MSPEITSGVLGLVFAGVATSTGMDVSVWHCAAAGLTGILGGWIFINPETASTRAKLMSMLASAAFASMLGPLAARWLAHENAWVGTANYFVTAAAGLVVGLVSTPTLRLLHNPGPTISFIASFIPFLNWGRRHGKD